LATVWWSNQAGSKIMVLDATTIQEGTTSQIAPSHFTCVSHASINGPQGICVQQHFDRDGDKISDLIEASNLESLIDLENGSTFHLNPAAFDLVDSHATAGGLWNGIKLPEEGIGYRHFYGTDDDLRNGDNFGTLRMVQILESVGRDWNLLPGLTVNVPRPRISIGDISGQNGQTCWIENGQQICHHPTGRESDIRYVRKDGSEGQYDFDDEDTTNPPYINYAQAETEKLVKLFCKAGVKQIWVDLSGRSQLQNLSITGCNIGLWDGHNHHFHVQLFE